MRPRAFSLIELVLVIAIISVMAAVALPRFAAAAWRYRADSAARRIIADLDFARARASARSATVSVKFDDKTHTYTLIGVADIDRAADGYTVVLGEEPYRASIVSVDIAGGRQIDFDGFGKPAAGGKIVIAAGQTQRTVTLDPSTGKATFQ